MRAIERRPGELHREVASYTVASLSPLGQAAAAYAAIGWPVLPCIPRGKEPLVAGGWKAATTTQARVIDWWRRWPEANIGFRPDGEVVVDVDTPDTLRTAVGRGLHLPPTAIVRTARGFHYHYLADRPVRSRTAVRPGIDLKGVGGYALLPPSIHPTGVAYKWLVSEDFIAAAPSWVFDSPGHRRSVEPRGAPILEGYRNSYVTALFGAMRRLGSTEAEMVAAGRAVNARCQPRLLDREICRIAASITRYEPAAALRARPHARVASARDRASRPPLEIRPPKRWTRDELANRMASAPAYVHGPLADEFVDELGRKYEEMTGQPISSREQWKLLAGCARVHGDDLADFVRDLFAATGSANNILGIIRQSAPRPGLAAKNDISLDAAHGTEEA
jgi:hypothetical protein